LVQLSVIGPDREPVRGAIIELAPRDGAPHSVRTDDAGLALIPVVEPGPVRVRTRSVGYKPGELAATVAAGRNTIPIILDRVQLPRLDTVRVVGGKRATGRLDEFETRRLRHEATVSITREEIVKRNPVDAWQMLANVPALLLVDSAGVVSAKSRRNPAMMCWMRVMVDGMLIANDVGAPDENQRTNLANLPRPEEIYGVEVFAGPASIPVQYGGIGQNKWCGLIAIWTR
jgi:hypothetical protein